MVRQLRGFNPRTRKGYDLKTYDFAYGAFASFNPRTRKGYDCTQVDLLFVVISFNPRTRKGYDALKKSVYLAITVSIHVPVKDTTACLPKALFITLSANDSANNDIRQ